MLDEQILPYWDSITNCDLLKTKSQQPIKLGDQKCKTRFSGCLNEQLKERIAISSKPLI